MVDRLAVQMGSWGATQKVEAIIMKNHVIRVSVCLCLLLCALSARADYAEEVFGIFSGLKGTWRIESGGKTLPFQMTYDVASHGTIVTEQFGKELSVFYRDGDRLLLTHFCNRGNQLRLRMEPASQPGLFHFEMLDITHAKNSETEDHVQRILYRMIGGNRIDLEIVWKKGGREESEKYTLTRS
jgi:hypothetical protein